MGGTEKVQLEGSKGPNGLSFSDMITFQERDDSGAKVCILNLEAFSVYIS